MALIDIEYGSLASSETMNKNFMYLDDKIAETSESIMTSISSILSNIATINARLNDISEKMEDSVQSLNTTLEEYKAKTKLLVNNGSMIPDWNNIVSISLSSSVQYKASTNGYIYLHSQITGKGNIIVNNQTVVYRTINSSNGYSSELTCIPVYKGDVISCTSALLNAYFVPVKEISITDF